MYAVCSQMIAFWFYMCFAQSLVWNLSLIITVQSANMQLGHGPGLSLALEAKISHLALSCQVTDMSIKFIHYRAQAYWCEAVHRSKSVLIKINSCFTIAQ